MKFCSYCGRENEANTVTCVGCGTEFPDGKDPVNGSNPQPRMVCPACGASDNYKAALALHGSFNWAVYFFGGFLAVLFQNASREKRVQCNGCGEFFGVRSRMSKVSLVLFWLLVAPTLLILLFVLLSALFSH